MKRDLYPYIIAEAGSCHEGSRAAARSLISAAARAGANAVKFQFWSSPQRMRDRRHVDDPKAYESGSIEAQWFPILRLCAASYQLHFMCTAYLPEDISVVAPYVDAFKVSSFEATPEFVEHLYSYKKPIYMSTGMSDQDFEHGSSMVTLLHCISAYPCPVSEANVGAVSQWRPGYSDHTRNVLTGAVAVGAGAKVLEVHFRLDDTSPACPDYCVSLTPEELRQYVANARLAHVLMGDGIKRVMPSEIKNLKHRVEG